MKFYLAFFSSSLSLRFSLFFFFLLQYCVRVVPSFLPERLVIVFIYGCASAAVALALERPRHEKFHNYQSIKRGRGWTDVMEFYEKSREKNKTEGDSVGVKWNPIEISYTHTCIRASKSQQNNYYFNFFSKV